MNLTQLITEVQRLTGRNDSGFYARIESAVNRGIRQWARSLPWPGLEVTGEITHTGGREMVLPGVVDRLMWILDISNYMQVDASDGQWDRQYPYTESTSPEGFAREWEDMGYTPICTTVSGPLVAYSSNASDVATLYVTGTAQSATLSGPLGQYRVVEAIDIIGNTPATTTHNYVGVESLAKSDDCDGEIVVSAAGGVVSIIDSLSPHAAYKKIRFLYAPATGTQFRYRGYVRPPELKNANQAPPPAVDPDFLIWIAAHDIYYEMAEGSRAAYAWKKAEEIAGNEISKRRLFGDYSARIVPEVGA